MTEARQRYDYVILDYSPILPVPDAAILASRADGTLLVIRVGRMPRVALRRAKALLDATSTRMLGVCLSGVRADLSSDYAAMASYGYRYGSQAEPAKNGRKRGLVVKRRGVGLWRAAIIVALLVLTAGVWFWRLGWPPFLSEKMAQPALARALAGVPGAQEDSRPEGFTVRLSVPGTVSIGQFGTRAEAEAYGRELIRAGTIKNFTVAPLSAPEE